MEQAQRAALPGIARCDGLNKGLELNQFAAVRP
jgi:hypothetical protein